MMYYNGQEVPIMAYNGKAYGDPLTAVRLPSPMLAAARMDAARHGLTLSGLIRDALSDRLDQDGVNWRTPSETIQGQQSLEDLIDA